MKFEIAEKNETETETIVKFKLEIDNVGDLMLRANNVNLLYIDGDSCRLWRIPQSHDSPFTMDEQNRIKDGSP